MNVDWAPGGRQPSDQTNRFGLRVRRKIGCCHPQTPSPFIIITQLVSWYSFTVPRRVEGWVVKETNSRIDLTLTVASKFPGSETSWLQRIGYTVKEVVQNKHHWSERTETATENKTSKAGSRRHCNSHSYVTSSVSPYQWCVFCTHSLVIFGTLL